MLCDNCGKNNANIKYTQIINGIKKEMNLCEGCGEKLGITNMQFDVPINFSNFLGDFLTEFQSENIFPEIKCNMCNSTFNDIVSTGKFGCSNCYDIFENRIDDIIRKIQGNTNHVGRIGKEIIKGNNKKQSYNNQKITQKDKLQEELNLAIKEERYEDAAIIRDKMKGGK